MFLNDLFYLKLLGLVPISLKRRVWFGFSEVGLPGIHNSNNIVP